jgi:hypothetical protein
MIKVYVRAPDLIEVEGDIRAQFTYAHGNEFLGFSDGTILRVFDNDGDWSVTPMTTGQNSNVMHKTVEQQREQGDDDAYSDAVQIVPMNGTIRVVVHGNEIGTTRKAV